VWKPTTRQGMSCFFVSIAVAEARTSGIHRVHPKKEIPGKHGNHNMLALAEFLFFAAVPWASCPGIHCVHPKKEIPGKHGNHNKLALADFLFPSAFAQASFSGFTACILKRRSQASMETITSWRLLIFCFLLPPRSELRRLQKTKNP
ncbi:MAG: hypothetical protein WBN18_00585, partial [Flavobacteriaceae bacterium]